MSKKTSDDLGMSVIEAMDADFHEQPDRVIAIVGAAYLDSTLDALLRAILIDSHEDVEKLMGLNGVLGANGTRCQLAYCLGLITRDQRDDLKKIAKIRNKFAHDFKIASFDISPIREQCAALKDPVAFAAMAAQRFSGDEAKHATAYVKSMMATPRDQFRTAVIGLFGALLRRLHYVRREDHHWFSYDPDAPTGPLAS